MGARFELVTAHRREVLAKSSASVNIIDFVHVYWSPGEQRVGILETGYIPQELAFDLTLGRPIPFASIRNDLAKSIAAAYHLSPEITDPIGWAHLMDASFAFFKLHPEVQLTYRQDH